MKEMSGAQYARKRGAAPWMHPERPAKAYDRYSTIIAKGSSDE